MSKAPRKLMSNIIQFLDKLDQDCIGNQAALKELALKVMPFNGIAWDDIKWDVTQAVQHKIRGHSARKNKNLNFNQNVPNDALPMTGDIADTIKSLSALRFVHGGQGPENQQRFIDGWKYVYDELSHHNYRLELITPEVLNSACRSAANRLAASTAYNVHKSVHEIADLIDANKLAKVHLGFRYSGLKRPNITAGVAYKRLDDPDALLPTQSEKMASDGVLEVLGVLYQKIPREKLADRVRILLVTLAVFTGRRIGEILTMPALPVQINENKTSYITIYPLKRSQGDILFIKEFVPLPKACLELIDKVINELLEITEPIRNVAHYIHEHQHADYRILKGYESKGWMSPTEICQCFGLSDSASGNTWANYRKLVHKRRPKSIHPRYTCFELDQIKYGMDQDIEFEPVLIANGVNIFHKDCMAILPLNAVHTVKSSFQYAVRLVNLQHMSDFLGNNLARRNGKEKYEKKGKVFSVFDKYLDPEESVRLGVNTHAFRHTLNTWLDEGGMSDAAQTRWFGRKNPRDTKAYQHTSPSKTALLVRHDLLKGVIGGPVANQLKKIPVNIHEAYVSARIKAVHDVGPGLCFHDFSQNPCERSLQCTANCDDFHWRKDDIGRINDIKRQYAITMLAQKTSEEKALKGRGKSKDWLVHNHKKVETLRRVMKESGVEDFDWEIFLLNEVSHEQN